MSPSAHWPGRQRRMTPAAPATTTQSARHAAACAESRKSAPCPNTSPSITLLRRELAGAALIAHLTFVVETGPDVVRGASRRLRKGGGNLPPTIVQAPTTISDCCCFATRCGPAQGCLPPPLAALQKVRQPDVVV